ncbi:IclR family transcriptional regulator [Bordetella hinzii]|uniref:Transcriptional regulator, IclR family, C-terminal domain protein n=1 Tax=Bordetella hinzii OH87 BAL007II TaxID=1331262 RepID=A0ABR4QXH5_9BORD|nr:helix-turn-helix domain-containing protein [Bordetella hinzii]AKQ53992.1 HTH-type transcriptional regulator KipR [Bordetella hinzii]KCB22416.1 transcriptional regulator, IclR family, C-terminal domain protein [Bordetella hinzii OH87 BAL007II]KCB29122.1 transcriptional regulator, IclR family, C-terminal domain protein [Bordetella hinzii CA90 BAL1384]KCB41942.1 transcriptional regulator, IclR family, C-terminal domain protein [Bordetella hinzii 5132]KCB43393.1 transcriptional regulator, IclR 
MPTSSGPRTLLKGMHVLSLLKAAAPAGLGATEVAVQTGLDRVNVQRLFLALEASGWVTRNKAGKRFYAGDDADSMQARLWTPPGVSRDLIVAAIEAARRLARQLGDAVFVIGRDGNESVGIHREIGDYPMQILASYAGKRHPMGVGSAGMALLASLSDAEARAVVRANSPRLEEYGGISAEMIDRLRVNARQRGYAVMQNYAVSGALGVGCALTRAEGVPVLAMSVSAITDRMPIARQAETARLLRRELDGLKRFLD